MGISRNGARTFLNILAKACKMSHLPGFRAGIISILGPEQAVSILGLWDPLCDAINVLIGLDNWYNQFDTADDDTTGEDTPVVIG